MLTQLSQNKGVNVIQSKIMAPKELVEVVSGNSKFANKLYDIIAKEEKGKNVFFSPINVHIALSMSYQGSAGKTADLFASTLNVSNKDAASIGYSYVMKALNSVKNVQLHVANKLYIKDGFPLKNNFRQCVKKHFFSETESVNFDEKARTARWINAWVGYKTNEKIKDVIQPDFFDALTRIVLVNVIYFKGDWAHPFLKERTRKEKFYISKTETVDCDMMHINQCFNCREDEQLDAQILELKYSNEDVSMVIILPRQRTGIEALEKKLVDVDLSTITEGMNDRYIEVCLPKFKMETTMNLNSVLSKLGLGIIFNPSQADFSETSEKSEPLYVSKVIQTAFIELNEEGTEAAAVLRGLRGGGCIQRVHFNVDHPFVILLQMQHEGINHILFYGRVARPKY